MSFLTKLAIAITIIGLALYIFGLPPQIKRKLERAALQTMGENKASYVVKDQIQKIPDSDNRDLNQLKSEAAEGVAGLTRNGLGQATGEALDGLTSGFTGR